MELKTISQNGRPYLVRLTLFKSPKFSVKVHLFLQDDTEDFHDHPRDFKSFLIIPYREQMPATFGNMFDCLPDVAKKANMVLAEVIEFPVVRLSIYYKPFQVVKRKMTERHRVKLYRFFGIPIPALTIGVYGPKKRLCSFCQHLGYCKTERGLK